MQNVCGLCSQLQFNNLRERVHLNHVSKNHISINSKMKRPQPKTAFQKEKALLTEKAENHLKASDQMYKIKRIENPDQRIIAVFTNYLQKLK
ncbi:hypothetical protein JL09_g5910 [Pichia kudriavzevii]|uniref:Uncharacterized protein n=1 Tax=Pichia kudriavzevii TaxID=4909 RepID=A0A099NSW0_PICKU|nr:hypothetical protein JL09_g5910 [Pichia kudriavzevii]